MPIRIAELRDRKHDPRLLGEPAKGLGHKVMITGSIGNNYQGLATPWHLSGRHCIQLFALDVIIWHGKPPITGDPGSFAAGATSGV